MISGDIAYVIIFVVYGTTFLVMAGVLWAGVERTAKLGIASRLNVLIVFAVVHGISDLVDAVLRMPGVPTSPTGPIAAVRLVLLAVSFLALLWFGLVVLIEDRKAFQTLLFLGVLVSVGLAAGLTALFAEGATLGSVQSAERAARLLLGLPGGLLASVGFLKVARRCDVLGLAGCARGAFVAAFGMAAYAVLAGGIATGYPEAFLLLGLPIQLHRMAAAIVITVGCVMMLRGLVFSETD